MKYIQHYTNVAFALLIVAALTVSAIDKDIGTVGFIIIAIGWAITQIIKNAVVSIAIILFDEE